MSRLSFKARKERFCTVLEFDLGGCRPATDVELECISRIAELEARNKRLEKALNRLCHYERWIAEDWDSAPDSNDWLDAWDQARAALSTKEDGT